MKAYMHKMVKYGHTFIPFKRNGKIIGYGQYLPENPSDLQIQLSKVEREERGLKGRLSKVKSESIGEGIFVKRNKEELEEAMKILIQVKEEIIKQLEYLEKTKERNQEPVEP